MLLLGGLFIFNFIVTFQIYTGIGNLRDLNIEDAKEIWWGRVILLMTVSFMLSFIIVFRNSKVENIIKMVVNTAPIGILLGYWMNRMNEERKSREDGKQSIINLQIEVSYNRRNCQAILKGWAPLLFQTFVWDNIKLSKHFWLLWQKVSLINQLSDLYLAISSANFVITHAQLASFDIVHSPDTAREEISKAALEKAKEYIEVEVLPKLEDMEKELADYYKNVVAKLSK
jgi:hypothetical protein